MGEVVGLFGVQSAAGDMLLMGGQARRMGMETKRGGLSVHRIDDEDDDSNLDDKKTGGRILDIAINDEGRIYIRRTEKKYYSRRNVELVGTKD